MYRLDRTQLYYRLIPSLTSMLIMLSMVFFYLTDDGTLRSVRERLEWIHYDLRLKSTLNDKQVNPTELPVVIVDIDEISLAELGHWPWSRDQLAKIVENLTDQGAVIIAFDVLFAEAQNQIQQQLQRYQASLPAGKRQEQANFFNSINTALDSDSRFAEVIANHEVVLSSIFNREAFRKGQLSHPLPVPLTQRGFIEGMQEVKGHVSNIALLQEAANYTGFINAYPDADGVMRRARLLQPYQGLLYPSLSLASSAAFLLPDEIGFNQDFIGGTQVLRSIQLFSQEIPVDGNANLLIPFVGPAYSFPYVSASTVLENTNNQSLIEGKIILIGSTAAALSDFRATPTNALYPGVEVHANVISGIINDQLFTKPEWSHGINFLLIVISGLLLALILPRLNPVQQLLTATVLVALLIAVDQWLWITSQFAIDTVVPVMNLIFIGTFNMAYGFVINSRDKQHLKSMFGQYVPPQLVEQMSLKPGKFSMAGDRREMSVLFADIRSFTSISEGLTAVELKDWLNDYFTPITEIIFKNQGTIDKYVGDMVMAFWGAPLNDHDHAYHATIGALAMLKKTDELREDFIAAGRPEVFIGVGISSGEMNVGNMGSVYRRSYTVLGDRVNLGSRLEGLTKFYGVQLIISDKTKADIGDRMNFRHLDRVQVKGKVEPIDIYEPSELNDPAENPNEHSDYQEALALYLTGEFESALNKFNVLQSAFTERKIYDIYIERCEELIKEPPAEWQGVFVHTSK